MNSMADKNTSCEIRSAPEKEKISFYILWNEKKVSLGTGYEMREMLENLAKLGYKVFTVFVEE